MASNTIVENASNAAQSARELVLDLGALLRKSAGQPNAGAFTKIATETLSEAERLRARSELLHELALDLRLAAHVPHG